MITGSTTVEQTTNKYYKIKQLLRTISKKRYAYAFMTPFSIIFIVFVILPVIVAIYYSFTSFDILQPAKWLGMKNYLRLFVHDNIFLIAVKNTFKFAAITGPLSYILCLLIAWIINEFSPRVRAFLTLLFYAPALSNIFIVWKMIFSGDSYGLLNSYLLQFRIIYTPINWLVDTRYMSTIIIVVMLWSSLGTSFLAFIAGLQSVDKGLYEAASVDGINNRWQELWYVTLPSMKQQLMFGAVMSITGSFGIGAIITSLVGFPSTDYAAHTIMNHLEDYGTIRFEMGYACAIATVLFVIMILLNELVQKIISRVGK